MTEEQQKIREAVARALYELPTFGDYYAYADAAIAVALEEAARVAEGPPKIYDKHGEVIYRGDDKRDWATDRTSDYGAGRMDAAADIRNFIPKDNSP